MSVFLFVSNKRQNGWTDQTQILFGTSRDPRDGLCIIKTSKICVSTLYIFCKILKMSMKMSKNIMKPKTFLHCTQRIYSHIKPQLKVEIEYKFSLSGCLFVCIQ